MSVTLTDQDGFTLRAAAYGAVTLMSAADLAGEPRKAATGGSIALASAGRARARQVSQGREALADMIRKITAALDAA
ncbi:hypothetical protein [Micromonospora parathelypteridis]|uniref:Uncharacterized protein n=1 Tax=Micromonospora parathelypteridis TaxID=1839617 RepID=A0A840VG91_9ACTN|nr:hypothetical protein [Micromonospora parathelypteridis]MBB5475655.1 hypothetical protein [Micromonospora parathelypteridis]GGO27196.1 hypothetical protein GCM10011576_51620 [Micromonospora parathelypteridis]